MTPERWQQVERIYQAAIDEDPSVRAAFVDRQCGEDADLRRDVMSLLEAEKPEDRFLESTALQVAARGLAGAARQPKRAQRLGSYELIALLGSGGMGEVWRALDPALNRQVAIKILPSEYSRDPDRLRRFEQEARAAGMLNHPNILAVYAIGREQGSPYLVTELLEGATLRERLEAGAISEGKALDYAGQIAHGLAAAHEKGIVHRDLKPENLFLTRDGRVKILDFGLAKLVQPGPERQDQVRTDSGVAVGTPAYMSPEQVRGQPASPAADIFALGAVLYEMLSGRRPFYGQTSVETMNAILKDDPPPIGQVSAQIEQIVRHCLEKEPEERFQSARDLAFQLQTIRSPFAQKSVAAPAARPLRYIAIWMAGALALAGITAALTWHLTRPAAIRSVAVLKRLTSDSGLSTDPALSPDGKLLAYASDRGGDGNLDIWLQQVGQGQAIRLTNDPADDREPVFSPDGTRIAFRSERGGGGIYIVSALGGAATLIAPQGRRPRFSPDGKQIAYWAGVAGDYSAGGDASRSYIVAATGGSPSRLLPDFAITRFPVWSPDGRGVLLLAMRERTSTAADRWEWWVAPAGGGPAINTGVMSACRQSGLRSPLTPATWTADGRVTFSASIGDSRNLWQISVSPSQWRAAGQPERLTTGAANEDFASEASGRIAFASLAENVDIWSLPFDHRLAKAAGEPRRLTEGASMDVQPAISADGRRLVFASTRAGNFDVWAKFLPTGEEIALTISPVFESRPAISPDGVKVAYNEWSGQWPHINIATLGGRREDAIATKVCDDCFLPWDWSPDNRHLLYWSKDMNQIGVIEVGSGKKQILLSRDQFSLLRCHFSPDGAWVAFDSIVGPDNVQLFVAPFRGVAVIHPDEWLPVTGGGAVDSVARWSPAADALYFVSDRDGYRCLWRQRLHPSTKRPVGEAGPVFHLHGARRSISNVPPQYLEISVARDQIVFPMNERIGNVWMIEWTR